MDIRVIRTDVSVSITILPTNFQRRPRDSKAHGNFFGLINARTAVSAMKLEATIKKRGIGRYLSDLNRQSPASGGINH